MKFFMTTHFLFFSKNVVVHSHQTALSICPLCKNKVEFLFSGSNLASIFFETMGSKQSKPVQQTQTSVVQEPVVKTELENADTIDATPKKLPVGHPKIDAKDGNGTGECPYKNPLKSIGGLFGKKQVAVAPKNNDSIQNDASQSGGCPVKAKSESNQSGGGCPVKASGSKTVYNVYSQPIDPTNNMPSVANQLPAPMQNEELSTERVKSTIPKGGTDGDTWQYPSPQMFYNSLARKNKLGDTEESDIASVVAIHNNMNEKTWAKVMEWEDVLCPEAKVNGGSKLLKFLGRPSDLSPKARIKNMLFGHPLPFDRHDWTIQRPDGTEVRYVIDYYVDETKADDSEGSGFPDMNDRDAIESILVDVRPAADSVENVMGRTMTMPYARRIEKSTNFEPLPMLPTEEMKQQIGESEKVWQNIQQSVQESKTKKEKSMILKPEDIPDDQKKDFGLDISEEEAREIAQSFATMLGNCKNMQEAVNNCKDEAECSKAALGLTMCLAKVVCPLQQNAVAQALNADDFDHNDEKAVEAYNAKFEKALENMTVCVTGKSAAAAAARQKYPDLFQNLEK